MIETVSVAAPARSSTAGRLKEMIKTGGVNVAPLEVEQVLLQHPDVVQVYVVGVPDQAKGEIVAVRFGHSTTRRRGARRPPPREDPAQARHALAGGFYNRTTGSSKRSLRGRITASIVQRMPA